MGRYSKAQSAVFAAPGYQPTYLTDLSLTTSRQLVARTIATTMKAPEFDPTHHVVGASGLHINSSLGVVVGSCLTVGSIDMIVSDWTVQKYWPLNPATPCSAEGIVWDWRMPILSGRARGWCNGDTDHLHEGGSYVATWNVFGSASFTAKITALQIGVPKRYGGSCPISIAFQASGLITTSGSPSTAFMHSDVEDPIEGDFTITNGSGPQPTFNALAYMLAISSNSDRGGPLIFRSSYRMSWEA